MVGRRPPWWIWIAIAPSLACLAFTCYVHIAGPEPAGWMLEGATQAVSGATCTVGSVEPGSPAARAGFKPGDLLLERDVKAFTLREQAGRQYRFEVRRGTQEAETVTLALTRPALDYWLSTRGATPILAVLCSAFSLALAVFVAFSRPRDTVALWGALYLASTSMFQIWFGVGRPAGIFTALRGLPVAIGAFLLLAPTLANQGPVVVLAFLAQFPRPAISSRLLWILVGVSTVIGIPITLYGVWLLVYAPDLALNQPWWFRPAILITAIPYLVVPVGLLAWNYSKLTDPNERRRVRVVVAGLAVSLLAAAVVFATAAAREAGWHHEAYQSFQSVQWAPWELGPFALVAPLCITYAIVRHRMFDIRIMIRQGIQYAAARGVLLSLVPVLALLLALDMVLHGDQPLVEILAHRGWLYLALAATAFLLHAKQKTWLQELDRRFFRERYDAQRLLREVVEEVRASRDFERAAHRVVSQIEAGLHPEVAAILVRRPGEAEYRALAASPAPPPPIPAGSKIMGLVRLLGQPVEVPQSESGWIRQQLPHEETEFLRQARLEWLFPVSLAGDGMEVVFALGPKRSEEPYSHEDQDLIKTIAASLALLLERSPAPAATSTGFEECPRCGACYDSGAGQCAHEGAALSPVPFPRLLTKRYRFERRLGRGGMGAVYEAVDTELERRVAVKLIRPELMASADTAARFRREAKAAAGFSHPNVVTVFDFGVGDDQRAFLVMELLRGRTVRQELQAHGRVAPARAVYIVRGVCAAVAAAHERRLLHRDLKPENIFLSQAGGVEVAKVLDFGVAKPIPSSAETITLNDTAPGVLVGTLRYMSPEQLSGGAAAESWDLWALAVVAYEMLTGAYPFSEAARRQPFQVDSMIPPRVRMPAAPETWDAFFRRALARDATLRPSSALQFAAEFQALAP